MSDLFITEKNIKSFQEDGAIHLKGMFSQHWIEEVKKGIEKNLANPSQYSERLALKEGQGHYFNDYCNWQKIPQFQEYVFQSPVAKLVANLMESKYAVFYHEHVLVKEAGTEKDTPWHQDQPYYPIDGNMMVSVWMPVDPVPLLSALQFVKGSHKWGRWFHPRKFATQKNYPLDSEVEEIQQRIYEDVPVAEIESGNHEVISWDCRPGDCIVFHGLTLHASRGNYSKTVDRRVLSTRWCGEDTLLARRSWGVSPPIMGGLAYGDKICSDVFPLVYGKI